MNKKFLIISSAAIIVILIGGFFAFGNFKTVKAPEQNVETIPQNTEVPENSLPEVKIEPPEIITETPNPQPGFYVCKDECGDGICQPAGTVCKDQLSCICAETAQDCPQDCR